MNISTDIAGAPNMVRHFTPVPLRTRRDGWTPTRQRNFLATLARTGRVVSAAQAVGLSVRSAYKLWHHPQAASFRAAWRQARAAAFELRRGTARVTAQIWTHPPIALKIPAAAPNPAPLAQRLASFIARHRDTPFPGDLGDALIAAFGIPARANGRCDFRELPDASVRRGAAAPMPCTANPAGPCTACRSYDGGSSSTASFPHCRW